MNSPSELPEFLATISDASSAEAALQSAIVKLAESFDAEVVAFVEGGAIPASVGFPRGAMPVDDLVAARAGDRDHLDIPGVGAAPLAIVELEDRQASVVFARSGDPLDASELAHAQAMIRVLSIALQLLEQIAENEQLLEEHRNHQAMLEAILRVQRLISQRRHIDTILQAITTEAATLLQADVAGICISGAGGIGRQALATGVGRVNPLVNAIPEPRLIEIGEQAAAGELITARHVAVICDTGDHLDTQVVGAPVFEDEASIGGLYVVAIDPAEDATEIDTAAVQTFASQAGIALTDARMVDELHHAFHDTLTGLPNRALFHDRFEHAVALANRQDTTAALLFIDLDHLKVVNDTFGHAAGDDLLRAVGDRIARAGRNCDSVARLGGDEFAMLLENTSAAAAELVARRVLQSIAEVENPAQCARRCSASIGIALSGPDCMTTDELLRRADIAMYAAKAAGRSNVAVYQPAMGRSRLDQRTMAATLETALARDDFVVHYQPIVSLQNRQITGAEALVRWHDAERGILNPADFIQAAEDTGMIVPIGRRVLQLACEQAATWLEGTGARGFDLNVNLSGRQLESDDILDDIQASLDTSGLPPSALTLEVTESIFVDDAATAGERLRSLKELGVGLAIDDFGTGFSSLSYIHHYPFDVLKIDRTFVSGLGTTTNGGALVKTLLSLAQQLGMKTVAEGVEKPVELAQLRALRCTHGQGFLFSPPVDAGTFSLLLGSRRLG